ncbi:hypothetical protein C5746_02605 [Streptomyces atratus]|uniref:Uncharacterized protein n=1 Tax=Streptomyces atratus TaxID=1893 RepID=A0A2Z5J6V5_STRAR|nr:hypothetical protein C5746_02605 [Streptomyces atratus]
MKGFGWLNGGNDRQLAATEYEGRESATDRAVRLDRERRARESGTDRAARLRCERHRARVIRDGDSSGIKPRGFRRRG